MFTALSDVLGKEWRKHGAVEMWGVLRSQAPGGNGDAGEPTPEQESERKPERKPERKLAVAKGGVTPDGQLPHPWTPAMWRRMFAHGVKRSKIKSAKATNAQKRDVAIMFGKLGADDDARHDFQSFVSGKASLTTFTGAEGDALKKLVASAVRANTLEGELSACLTALYDEIALKA